MYGKASPLRENLPLKDDGWWRRLRVLFDDDAGEYSLVAGEKILFRAGGLGVRSAGKWLETADPGVHWEVEREAPIEDSDQLGSFQLLNWTWSVEGVDVVTEVKVYRSQPVVAWGFAFPRGLATEAGKPGKLCAAFPCATNSSTLALAFGYGGEVELVPTSVGDEFPGPLVLYNENFDALAIGADRNFSAAVTRLVDGQERGPRVLCGLRGAFKQLPAGIWHEVLWVFANGVVDALDHLGQLVRLKYDRQEPSLAEDLSVSHLGCHPVAVRGPAGSSVTSPNLPCRHAVVELGGGRLEQLLAGRGPEVGAPETPEMPVTFCLSRLDASEVGSWSHDFVVEEHEVGGQVRRYALVDDFSFWEKLSDRVKSLGGICLQVRDVGEQWQFFDHFKARLESSKKWLVELSMAADSRGLSVSFGQLPPNLLGACAQLPNVSQVCCGTSRAENARDGGRDADWVVGFAQAAWLAWSLGIVPCLELESARLGRAASDLELLVAALSCGPVIIDPSDDRALLTCRPDGLLLKPDHPLAPVDLNFVTHDKHYWLVTASTVGDLTWHYWLGVGGDGVGEPWVTPWELGVDLGVPRDASVAYWTPVPDGREVEVALGGCYDEVPGPRPPATHAHVVASPPLGNNSFLLGLANKLVPGSAQVLRGWHRTGHRRGRLDVEWVAGRSLELLLFDPDAEVEAAARGARLEANEPDPKGVRSFVATCRGARFHVELGW
ncbi:MAG: hypothetical protein Kow0069_04930 [Promethearchaeota archaeon]